jgi:hypothetical protein
MPRSAEVPVKLILACLFALIALPSFATDLTVACTPNLTMSDGLAIPAGTPMQFTLYGSMAGAPLIAIAPGLSTCSSVRTNVNSGVLQYAYTETVAGVESAQSAVTSYTVAAPITAPSAPGAPTVTVVTTSTIAYGLAPSNDRLAFLIVGSVPLGTACLADQSANTFRVVPRTAVTYDKPYTSKTVTTVFALCSG